MRTREIRDRFKSMGVERATLYCLEAINEELLQTRRDLQELATYFDKMVESFDGVVNVAARMKETIEKNEQRYEDELGPNTNSLDKDDMT